MGQMLQETERAPAGRKPIRSPTVTDSPPTLKELNVSKRESSEAQKLAALPDEAYEEVREGKQSRTQAPSRTADGCPRRPRDAGPCHCFCCRLQMVRRQVRIPHHHLKRLPATQPRDRTQINPLHYRLGCERVPQMMKRDVPVDPRPLQGRGQRVPNIRER